MKLYIEKHIYALVAIGVVGLFVLATVLVFDGMVGEQVGEVVSGVETPVDVVSTSTEEITSVDADSGSSTPSEEMAQYTDVASTTATSSEDIIPDSGVVATSTEEVLVSEETPAPTPSPEVQTVEPSEEEGIFQCARRNWEQNGFASMASCVRSIRN